MEEKCVCHINGYKIMDPEAAPAGFGLGSEAGSSCGDCNNAVKNGWYITAEGTKNVPYYDRNTENIPLTYGMLFVQSRWDKIYQAYYACTSGCYGLLQRYSADYGATWTEWEWIDPTMHTGVEYRTTERFDGKPVYAKMINASASLSTTTTAVLDIPHGIENFGQVVRCTARIGACVLPIIEQTGNISVYWVNATNVRMKLNNYSHTKKMGIDIRYVKA